MMKLILGTLTILLIVDLSAASNATLAVKGGTENYNYGCYSDKLAPPILTACCPSGSCSIVYIQNVYVIIDCVNAEDIMKDICTNNKCVDADVGGGCNVKAVVSLLELPFGLIGIVPIPIGDLKTDLDSQCCESKDDCEAKKQDSGFCGKQVSGFSYNECCTQTWFGDTFNGDYN